MKDISMARYDKIIAKIERSINKRSRISLLAIVALFGIGDGVRKSGIDSIEAKEYSNHYATT